MGPALNDIQQRLVNTLAVTLAEGSHGDLKAAEKELATQAEAMAKATSGRLARDASLGDKAATAQLQRLQGAVSVAEATLARCRAGIEAEEAGDLRELVSKVLDAEAASLGGGAGASAALGASAAADAAMRCESCGNADPTQFLEDGRAGDVVCRRCGAVLTERRVVDKDWTRGAFADEGDMTQQGPPVQAHHSGQWNLRTAFGEAPGVSKADLAQRRRVWAEIERKQEAAAVRTGSRTTQAYRDRMKSDAFSAMEAAGERLRLHRAIVERGKALFSRFRDERENVHRFRAVVAACMAVACAEAGVSGFGAEAVADGGAAAAARAGDTDNAPPPDRPVGSAVAPSVDARPRLMGLKGGASRQRRAAAATNEDRGWSFGRRGGGGEGRALKRARPADGDAASSTAAFLGGGGGAAAASSTAAFLGGGGGAAEAQPALAQRRAETASAAPKGPSRLEQLLARAKRARGKRAK